MESQRERANKLVGHDRNEIKAWVTEDEEFCKCLWFLFAFVEVVWLHVFYLVCVLQEFILNQDWNDPKSQLQQCCLTLRTEGKEPDIPLYK